MPILDLAPRLFCGQRGVCGRMQLALLPRDRLGTPSRAAGFRIMVHEAASF
jgi:hypothetical protein